MLEPLGGFEVTLYRDAAVMVSRRPPGLLAPYPAFVLARCGHALCH
jgi:hypothetical protein